MGGQGSGRWRRVRPVVESQLRLDVRDASREGWLVPGFGGVISYSIDGERIGGAALRAEEDALNVAYSDGQHFAYRVRIVRAPCRLGGSRPWFLCPTCDARVAVLYIRGPLNCRRCHRLGYRSQKLGPMWRTQLRVDRFIERWEKLAASRRLRPATESRLQEELDRLEAIAADASNARLGPILGRLMGRCYR